MPSAQCYRFEMSLKHSIRAIAVTAAWLMIFIGEVCTATLLDVQQASFYAATDQQPLAARIHSAPAQVVQLAFERNSAMAAPVLPQPAARDHPLKAVLTQMLHNLPEQMLRLAEAHVKAIYLVDGNFGSARTEAVMDEAGRVVGGYMVMNTAALARTANEWISWRERSAFRSNETLQVKVTLEAPEADTQENALEFLFLHELGHILGMVSGTHGFWAAPETFWLTARSPFTGPVLAHGERQMVLTVETSVSAAGSAGVLPLRRGAAGGLYCTRGLRGIGTHEPAVALRQCRPLRGLRGELRALCAHRDAGAPLHHRAL